MSLIKYFSIDQHVRTHTNKVLEQHASVGLHSFHVFKHVFVKKRLSELISNNDKDEIKILFGICNAIVCGLTVY